MWNARDDVVVSSLVLALLFVVIRACARPRPPFSWFVIGKGTFDLKSSWVSNTTLVGAVLASAVRDLKLDSGLGALNLLFVALGLLAVVVHMAAVRAAAKTDFATRVSAYFVSAFLAIWAAAGQLFTLGYVVSRADNAVLTPLGRCMFVAVVVLAELGVLVYAWKTMQVHLDNAVATPPSATYVQGSAAREFPAL